MLVPKFFRTVNSSIEDFIEPLEIFPERVVAADINWVAAKKMMLVSWKRLLFLANHIAQIVLAMEAKVTSCNWLLEKDSQQERTVCIEDKLMQHWSLQRLHQEMTVQPLLIRFSSLGIRLWKILHVRKDWEGGRAALQILEPREALY